MMLDKKTALVSFVILFVLGIVFFNLEEFTGDVTNISPKIYLSLDPDIMEESFSSVQPGDKVFFTVETGSKGVRRTGYIYEYRSSTSSLGKASVKFDKNCGGGSCRANKVSWGEYRIPDYWEGTYCVRVTELRTNDMFEKCFVVI